MTCFEWIAKSVLTKSARAALPLAAMLCLAPVGVAQAVDFDRLDGLDLPYGDIFDLRHTDRFKNISRQACEEACAAESLCRAYTWNQRNGWCFLKDRVNDGKPHKDAISGVKRMPVANKPDKGSSDDKQDKVVWVEKKKRPEKTEPEKKQPEQKKPTGSAGANEHIYLVQNTRLNARSGPGGEHDVVMRLEASDRLVELDRQGDWSQVRLPDGQTAWVHNGYISKPFDLSALDGPVHPKSPDVSPYLANKDYVIRSRVGLSSLATDVRFDPGNDLVWMASGEQVRAFGMNGAMYVSQTMTEAQKRGVFASQRVKEHPLFLSSSLKKKNGKWVVEDNETGDVIFSFDYKKGDGDTALHVNYQYLPPNHLAYAYYASGKIRIWDVANKVLVREYKQPRAIYPRGPNGGLASGRYMLVDSVRATRKITDNERRIAVEGLKQAWSDAFRDKHDKFVQGMKQLGIAPEKKLRVMDLMTGRISAVLEPYENFLGTCLTLGETIMVEGRPLYIDVCNHSEGDNPETDRLAVWDLKNGKLLWSYQTRINELVDHNGKRVYHYNLKADRIVLPSHDKKQGYVEGDTAKRLEIRQLSTGKKLQTASTEPSELSNGWATSQMAITDDGKHLAVGGPKGEVMLIDMQSGEQLWRSQARAFEEVVEEERYQYEPDWELDKVHIGDLLAGKMPRSAKSTSKSYSDSPRAYALRSEEAGLEVVDYRNADELGGYMIRDIQTGDEIARIESDEASFGDSALTPGGNHFAIVEKKGSDTRFRLYETRTGKPIADLANGKGEEEWAFHGARSWTEGFRNISDANAVFSPDGRWVLLAGSEFGWKLHDIKKAKTYSMKARSPYDFAKLSFDAHSQYLVRALVGGKVNIIDLKALKSQILDNGMGTENDFYSFNFQVSNDGSRAVQSSKDQVTVWDLEGRKVLRQIRLDTDLDGNDILCGAPLSAISNDAQFAAFHVCRDGRVVGEIWNLEKAQRVATQDFAPSRFSDDNSLAYVAAGINHIQVARSRDGAKMVELMTFEDGSWIMLTPQGFFNASEDGAKNLSILKGLSSISIDQAYDVLYRPDLVKEALLGDPDGKLAVAGSRLDLAAVMDNGVPPEIRSVAAVGGNRTEKREVTIEAEIALQSGGLGRVEVRVNGNLQNTCDAEDAACRGLGAAVEVAPTEDERALQKVSRKVVLSPGPNAIEVTAYNKRNQIASVPGRIEVVADFKLADKADLHILAIGINDYYDSGLKLQYALSDATGIIDGFSKAASGHFGQVHVTKVFDEDATKAGIEAAFDKVSKEARTEDVFLFYIAGHGKSQDGHYYYLPQDFVDKGKGSIEEQGIGREKWRGYFSRVLAEKSVLLYDTCESGSLVSRQSRSLTNRAVADRLKRATGRSTLAATSEEGVALEGIGGHGVFTYSILEGLTEADSDNDNFIELTELAGYIQKRLPALSHEYFGYRQIPETQVVNSFPLGQKIAKQVQSSDQFIPSTSTHVVIAKVDVRKTGDEGGEVTQSLAPGTLVRLVEDAGDWAQIARNGKLLGYVPKGTIVAQQ